MFNYTVPGEPYFNTAQNSGNINLEGNWPQVSGSTSSPLLLYYVYKRTLYVNSGGSPLWTPLAQIAPNQIIQTLSQPLLGNVIAQLQASPINDLACITFANMLNRGF
jgi:hypothetical protein